VKHVVTIGVEIPARIVVSKRNIGSGVGAIEEGLATGALIGVVVIAVDCLSKRLRDVNALAAWIHFTSVSAETGAPNAGEVVIVIGRASNRR
jgi:hypothetical protein